MSNDAKKLERLNRIDIVYVVFIIVALGSLYLDKLEKQDIESGTNKNEKIIRNGKIILLVTLLICYIYFEYDKLENQRYGTPLENTLDIGASALIVIALIILIGLEIFGNDPIIDIV